MSQRCCDWEWLGIDENEWPPQRLDWEIYRIEHLSFASNMEASFAGWLQQPWHILYSALRCMSCQEWQQQHVCPICRNTVRNSGGTHDAWAYFNGCLTHLATAPKCAKQPPPSRVWTSGKHRGKEKASEILLTHCREFKLAEHVAAATLA